MSETSLDRLSVEALHRVGPHLATKLKKLGLYSIQDLLFHLPLRYIDRTQITPIGGIQPMTEVVIEGEVRASDIVFGRRRSLVCRIQDHSGVVTLRFFHFNRAQQERLKPGTKLRCFGEVRRGKSGVELYHPEYQTLDQANPPALEDKLTPIYPATEGITQSRIRDLCSQALERLKDQSIRELLPPDLGSSLRQELAYSLPQALRLLHNPPPGTALNLLAEGEHPAQQRLAAEELIAHNLSLLKLRQQVQQQQAPVLTEDKSAATAFLEQLPFSLTAAQHRVAAEISSDISTAIPMLRLVQGDVGSGKTIVAALAVLESVTAGYQAAMMAPTELLAEQHFQTFKNWLSPLGIKVGWCVGKQTVVEKRRVMAELVQGEIDVLVGTHALFQDNVIFARLGIVVIDEQHRFGVHQRLALRDKGRNANIFPHQLVMTATPIPRTLAMTAYADLDVSVIDELPPGRTAITTAVIPDTRRQNIIERVHIACQQSRQVYWVCTLVEESEKLQCKAAEDAATELQLSLPDCRVALIHGRMKSAEKDQIMMRFKSGEIDLLVATTVIEVGVDVPNASLMIIENAERLGLAQLHQLRGRVGRGKLESQCVLMYRSPLSENGQSRLSCLRDTNDGFLIAQRDLELRGPGELLGTRQTGLPEFRVANLMEDQDLINLMPAAADNLLTSSPENSDALVERWFGHKIDFGQV